MRERKLQKENQILQFSIIRKHVVRDGMVTNYIRKRLSIQNGKNRTTKEFYFIDYKCIK